MDELLQDFVAETRETLEAIGEAIVAWEAAPHDRSRLDAIFRFIHTVKGSCGFLDLPRLERLSHAAEGALADVRADLRTPDRRMVDAVLAIIDRIAELVEAIASGSPLADGDDRPLIAALAIEEAPEAAAAAGDDQLLPALRAPVRSVRVSVELLDQMMAGVSELVLARNEIARLVRGIGEEAATVAFDRLAAAIDQLREGVTRTRMARADYLFASLPRTVRDLSVELGKPVRLEIDGGGVELDREMIEMVRDPLLHIIRNSLDHGIEPGAERAAAAKPEIGSLRVAARQSGNQIEIRVSDDGRGIDDARVAARAVAAGLIEPEVAAQMTAAERRALVFLPGLSTASEITAISGRGVGMDVVRANIERLGGTVTLDSTLGQGTQLTLAVPLTLTILPALTVATGGQCFALPRVAIEEIVRLGRSAERCDVGGAPLVRIRGERLPLVSLAGSMGLAAAEEPLLLVVRQGGGAAFALAVEQVRDHEELVVKPAAPIVAATGPFGGVTLPEDGQPMLLLDCEGLAAAAGIEAAARPIARSAGAGSEAALTSTLLFRDLDGRERAIRLGLIDRIEDAPASAFAISAGRLRFAREGRMIPVPPEVRQPEGDRVRVLRIGAGSAEIAYPIAAVIDVVMLGEGYAPAARPGLVMGAVLIEDRQVELVDPHWLLASAGDADPVPARPLALIAMPDDRWARDVLGPLVEAAGYRVAMAGGADPAEASVILLGEAMPNPGGGGAVVRLADEAERCSGDLLWRHDRAGLLARLARVGGRQ